MTFPTSSRIASSLLTRSRHQRDLVHVAIKSTSTSHFSTLTSKNFGLHENDELARDLSRPQTQLTMSPCHSDRSSRHYGTSLDEARHYAGWTTNMRPALKTSISRKSNQDGWTNTSYTSDSEFDPILNIRAINPLIFESNYDLEEYGPSFRKAIDNHDALIQEWRIRNDRAV